MASETSESSRVLIVVMPFASPEFPSLGATLIRSILNQSGLTTDIFYGNLVFSDQVNADPFIEKRLTELPICELAFTPYYFDVTPEQAARDLHDYVVPLAIDPRAHDLQRYKALVADAGACLDRIYEAIDWQRYDVVGFSLMMGQTLASMAMARRIKRDHPNLTILLGGAHTQAPMGDEMLRSFPEVDYVLQGEADNIVVPFVRALRSGERRNFPVGGVLYRDDDGAVCSSGEAAPVEDLDELAVPDFSEFFRQMADLELVHVQPYMPLETSRGCWWGAKHHCTFCGIDDKIMVFRSKSPSRVLDEICTLSATQKYTEFFAVDSIINYKFVSDLLPALGDIRRDQKWDFSFFFESKSNISTDTVQTYRYGGVNHVQPGLESFSDHVLTLMNKGTTAARQIQCLRLLAENDIVADWNLIFGNPGETRADYDEIVDLIPYIHHLPPLHSGGLIPMQINRYAPYFEQPQRHGITNIRPKSYYAKIFPDARIDLHRLGFYFDCDYEPPLPAEVTVGHKRLEDTLDDWRAVYRPRSLVMSHGPGWTQVVDDREAMTGRPSGSPQVHLLTGIAAKVLHHCKEVRTAKGVHNRFDNEFGAAAVDGCLDHLVENRLVYRSPGSQLIALPLEFSDEGRRPVAKADGAGRDLPALRLDPPGNSEASAALRSGHVAATAVTRDTAEPTGHSRPLMPPAGARPWSVVPISTRGTVNIMIDGRSAVDVVAEIEWCARHDLVCEFDFDGSELFARPEVVDEVGRLREQWPALTYRASVPSPMSPTTVAAAATAGVRSVSVSRRFANDRSILESTVECLRVVKFWHAAGSEVEWHLDSRAGGASPAEVAQLNRVCAAAVHLPPPLEPGVPEPMLDFVRRWRRDHRPRTLTYARGPGFMKVFDRRGSERQWRFVTLSERQGDALLANEWWEPSDTSAASGEGPLDASPELTAELERQGLLVRGGPETLLPLPIRRSRTERWASGDY